MSDLRSRQSDVRSSYPEAKRHRPVARAGGVGGRITTSDARDLDRAMLLLQRRRITYGRWVETLDAWARGENVTTWDYGTAESTVERVLTQFAGRAPVTAGAVVEKLGVSREDAAQALHRLARRRLARRVAHGQFSIAPFGGRDA